MRIEQIGIAVVLFGLFITLGIGLYTEQVNNYGLPSDGIVMGKNYLDSDKTLIDNTEAILADSDVSSDNSDSAVAKAGIPGAKDITNYKSSFGEKIEYTSTVLKLPAEIKNAAMLIIGILISAFIIYMFRGFQPQKD